VKFNAGTTMGTAVLRGLYNALGAGAAAFLTSYAVTDDVKGSLIVAGITALGALGFRGAVEGLADVRRDIRGDVRPGDVGGKGVMG
jgi:hypothetical protein